MEMLVHHMFLPMLGGGCAVSNPCETVSIMYPYHERMLEVNPDVFEKIWRTDVVRMNGWSYEQVGIWSSPTPDFISLHPYEDQFYLIMYENGYWVWLLYQEEPTVYDE